MCIYICEFRARFGIKLAHLFPKKSFEKKHASLMQNRTRNLQV
jgi:hypothetical protein